MPDWIPINETLLAWLASGSIVTFIGSLILVPIVIVRMPADYFVEARRKRRPADTRHFALKLAAVVAKNTLGVIFLLAGIAMLVLPGQGLLTMLVGIMLMNFPGKYRFERWLVSQRPVLVSLNWIRKRRGRPPFDLDS